MRIGARGFPMPLFTALGSALRLAPMQTLARAPLAMQRSHVPARTPMVRMMCQPMSSGADVTVVDKCKKLVEDALAPQELEVKGAFDDPNGSHIAIRCVAEAFEGKRSLARQQMVFKAIWDEMQPRGNVHAVDTMILKAPSEV